MQPPPQGPPNPYGPNPGPNPYAPPQHGHGPPGYAPGYGPGYGPGYAPGPGPWPPYNPAEVQARVDDFNKKSFLFGVPGLLLQGVGNAMNEGAGATLGTLVSLVGSGLLIYGLSWYARSRGHSPWLGLLGFLSCLGLLILAVLPKKCLVCTGPVKLARCQQCGAPGAK